MAKAILLAEDYEEDARAIQLALEYGGIANPVFTVTDGDQVIAYLKGEGRFSDREKFPLPAVLLLDIKMPRVSGFQVLEWLKANPPAEKILVIVLSGHDEVYQMNTAYALGAASFLAKPLHPQDVRNLVKMHETFFTWNPAAANPRLEQELE